MQNFKKLPLPPGVYRQGTEYQAAGRWFDANLIRFYQGEIRPIGGWEALQDTSGSQIVMDGACRGMSAWTDDSNQAYAIFGTNEKLYAYTLGVLTDITPSGFTPGGVDSDYSTVSSAYGANAYGFGPYGGYGTEFSVLTPAMTWSTDIFGDYAVACATGDGKIYVWDKTGLAEQAANSPEGNIGVFVTPENFLVAIGASSTSRLLSWASQGTTSVWTPSDTNSAGSTQVVSEGRLMAGRRTRSESLVWTSTDLFSLRYIGGILVYGIEQLGRNCGPISTRSMACFDSAAVWMGNGVFYVYNGRVDPLACEVEDYIFNDFNYSQAAKVWALHVSEFGEIWFFYPSALSMDIDRYVIWNYRENHWSIGGRANAAFVRTAGHDRGAFDYPIMTEFLNPLPGGPESDVWFHENGNNRQFNDIDLECYLRSGPLEMGDGNGFIDIMQIIPDRRNFGSAQISFFGRTTPQGNEYEYGPFGIQDYVSVRMGLRQLSVQVTNDEPEDWRIGDFRFDVRESGMKR